MEELSLIDVLCNAVVGEQIMKYLNIRDVAALMQSCKTLHEYLNSNQIWRILHRIHFNKTPFQIYKQSYLKANICGREARIGDEWFVCTNSPVYLLSICCLCKTYVRMCIHCVIRERLNRRFCTQCDMYYYICKACHIVSPDSNVTDRIRECNTCNNYKCIIHFIGFMACCIECMIEHPEIIEENIIIDDDDNEIDFL